MRRREFTILVGGAVSWPLVAIGAALLQHLAAIVRQAGLKEFIADVLPSKRPMLKLFAKCGLPASTKRDGGTIKVTLQL